MLKKITGSILTIMLMTTMFLGAFGVAAPKPVHAAGGGIKVTATYGGTTYTIVSDASINDEIMFATIKSKITAGTMSNQKSIYAVDGSALTKKDHTTLKIASTGTGSIVFSEENPPKKSAISVSYQVTQSHTHSWNNNSYSASGNVITATCQGSGTCSLTKPTLTLNATGKTYDGSEVTATTTPSSTWTTYIKSTPTISYSPANSKNVGTYTASVTKGNATATKQFTISPKTVGLTWGTSTFDYDGNSHVPTATASGLVSGDPCTVTVDGAQTAAGSYTATASSLSNSNYKLPSANTKSFTINKKKLTLTGVTANDKVYDGNDEAILEGEAALNGIEEGDDVSIDQVSAKYTAGKAVGTKKAVTATATLTGEDARNYEVTPLTNLTADITKKTVTVGGIEANGKVYDGTNQATVDTSKANFPGMIAGDKLTISATGEFHNPDVGENKDVHLTLGDLSGNDAGNYELDKENSQKTATASIKPKTMTVNASGYEAEWDGNPHSISVSVTDPADGYTITYKGPKDSDYRSSNPEFTDPGEYEVSYKVVAQNYQETTGTAKVKIIGKDFEGIKGSDYSAVYDRAEHGITVTVPSTYEPYTVTYSETADGEYKAAPILYKDFTNGPKTVYYKVSKTGFNDYIDSNTVDITKKPVTVTGITAKDKTYDGKTTAELVTEDAQFAGLIDGDKLTVSTTGTFFDKNAAPNKTVNFGALTLGGDSADNYELAATGNQESATATINKKEITVNGITSLGKKYDGTTDATNSLYFGDEHLVGKVKDDDLNLTATGEFEDKNVGKDKRIDLSNLTLTGSDAENYVLAATGQQTATIGNITEFEVNVEAVDKEKFYGEDDPAFEFTYNPDLVVGDSFEGALSREEGEDVGTYTITAGTLHDQNKNYAIKYTEATFTIKQATTNNVTASIEGWTYGDNPKTPSATADFGADTATFTYSKTADGEYSAEVPTEAGTWYVKATVPETNNYVKGVSEPFPFEIAKKEVSLKWDDTELTYNGTAQKPKATATGLKEGDECEVTVAGEQTDANAKTGTENYTAEATELDNPNYKLPDNKTTTFTIAPKPITQDMLSVDNDMIKHDGSEQGPKVSMKDGDLSHDMIDDEDYTLSGDVKSSKKGTHVITITGKGNYTDSIETSWVMYGDKQNSDKEEGVDGAGDIEIFVDVDNRISTLKVNNFTIELAKSLLTEEDMNRYMQGENVVVYMLLKEQTESETGAGDRYILGQLFRSKGATDIAWYDITVWKKIGNSAATKVHNTVQELSMSVEVPDIYKAAPEGYTREFYFGRSHDGAATMLAQTSSVKIGFSSSKFSTYALALKDTKIPEPDPDKSDNPDDSDTGDNGNGSSSSKGGAKTGDSNDIAGLMTLMLASTCALGAVGYRRRRETDK